MNTIKISEFAEVTHPGDTTSFPLLQGGENVLGDVLDLTRSLHSVYGIISGTPVAVNTVSGTGDIDMYTVPSGKRFLILIGTAMNQTASTITSNFKFQAYIDGAYRSLTTMTSSIVSGASHSFAGSLVLEAGEKFGCNRSTTDLYVYLRGILFDASIPIYSPRLTTLSSTNTLYTVPEGKTAISLFGLSPGYNTVGFIGMSNYSGFTVKYTNHIVPNGESASNQNLVSISTGASVSSSSVLASSAIAMALGELTAITVDPDRTDSGQFVWTNVLELPYSV